MAASRSDGLLPGVCECAAPDCQARFTQHRRGRARLYCSEKCAARVRKRRSRGLCERCTVRLKPDERAGGRCRRCSGKA